MLLVKPTWRVRAAGRTTAGQEKQGRNERQQTPAE
jgi:hypothetical protein